MRAHKSPWRSRQPRPACRMRTTTLASTFCFFGREKGRFRNSLVVSDLRVDMPNPSILQPHQVLTADTIRVDLAGRTKDDVINALLDVVATHPAVIDPEGMRRAVFEREKMMSTGVGKGLGLPHAKTAAVTETVAAFAITADPVDFGAVDDQKVRLVFLLVGTEAAKSEHIKILSRISRLLNRDAFRERLLQARDADEVLALLEEGELQLATR